jgi:putative transposase
LDQAVTEFRERRLDHIDFPYVFVDATYVKAHDGARVVSKAIIVATGVSADGNREVLGLAVGEDKAFWTAFLRSLRARALAGVRAWSSPDAHEGLRTSIEKVMLGAALQRCRVHFHAQCPGPGPRGSQEMVAAAIRTVFAQPDAAAVADQLDSIAGKLGRQFPAVETMLRETATDVCAFTAFPIAHWKKVWSTNPVERVNKDIKRRTNVVGIFPTKPACCDWPDRFCSRARRVALGFEVSTTAASSGWVLVEDLHRDVDCAWQDHDHLGWRGHERRRCGIERLQVPAVTNGVSVAADEAVSIVRALHQTCPPVSAPGPVSTPAAIVDTGPSIRPATGLQFSVTCHLGHDARSRLGERQRVAWQWSARRPRYGCL